MCTYASIHSSITCVFHLAIHSKTHEFRVILSLSPFPFLYFLYSVYFCNVSIHFNVQIVPQQVGAASSTQLLCPSAVSPSVFEHICTLWNKMVQTHLVLFLPQLWNQPVSKVHVSEKWHLKLGYEPQVNCLCGDIATRSFQNQKIYYICVYMYKYANQLIPLIQS